MVEDQGASAAQTGLSPSVEPTSAVSPAGAASIPSADTYRGWRITRGRWPEPAWMAIGPNYDTSYEGEEDGFVDNGEKADAPTRDALIAEIDAWFEENAS